ncbi:MAG: hypothetical protein SFY32_16660 [Bacteroidota bacterium]|nr:hypothetical protein [Bacteroidota bacterium]
MLNVIFCALPIHAQFSITKNEGDRELIIKVMDKIYNFEFDEAKKLLPEVKKRIPNHPIYDFLEAMNLYWQIVPISNNHPLFKDYVNHINNVLKLSEPLLKSKDHKEEAFYFLLAAHSSLTLVNVKMKDYMGAINEARSSYLYMKEGFALTNKNPEFHFSTGLYNFYAEQYPNTHPFMRPFMYFFAKGSIKFGLEELERGSKLGHFCRTESMYFLGHVNLKYLSDPHRAYPNFKALTEKYPNNLWYLCRYVETLILLHRFEEAKNYLAVLDESNLDYYKFSAHVFHGMIEQLQNNNIVHARTHFLKAIKISDESKKNVSDYKAFVYCYLGLGYEKEKNIKMAKYYIDKAEDDAEYEMIRKEIRDFNLRN